MKKLTLTIIITYLCLILKAQYNSSDGSDIQPTGTYRTLNIFINIIYDKTPAANPFPNNDTAWPYTNIEGVTTTVAQPILLITLTLIIQPHQTFTARQPGYIMNLHLVG